MRTTHASTVAPMHSHRALLRQLGRALAPSPCLGSPAPGCAVVLPLAGGLRRRLAHRRTAAPPRVAPAPASAEEAVAGGQYPFGEVEERWQRYWETHATFRTPDAVDTSKPKFYALDMFPYPSGAGLHVGHPEGYTATDIMARYKRMLGFNVLHPMGWDAFGLPAEQYAIDTGTHPSATTRRNIDRFRQQLKSLGFSYDWQRELATCDVQYYRWTQWIFLRLFERGLAYQAEVAVNWCPALGTVLANEEVIDGLSERGSHPVIRRPMRQWMLRITAYADRLLEDLDGLDWPESIKDMQRNWIGRSIGIQLSFQVHTGDAAGKTIDVFTTRPDTLFGVTYLVVAPEHPLTLALATADQRGAVEAYLESASRKSDLERTELSKEKTGVWTGAFARNPATGLDVPIWVADYVLGGYGCGAVMAVPAHDVRDAEFAAVFGLPVLPVISADSATTKPPPGSEARLPFTGTGKLMNSCNEAAGLDLNGKATEQAADAVAAWAEQRGLGSRKVNYKLRDWLFARQRYWGEPFPVVFLEGTEEAVPLRDEDLPVVLPSTDSFRPSGNGEGPLANLSEWVHTVDPSGRPARRETNTMPQWAGSCWYYLRFINPQNDLALVGRELESYWMPVDLYVGGAEHAVLHLLYARFWHKVLFDIGVVSTKEPFQKLVSQGMILGEVEYTALRDASGATISADDSVRPGAATVVKLSAEDVVKKGDGYVLKADPSVRVAARAHKMSKSRGNVVNPDDVVKAYGADSLRLYEMFMGPLRETKVWSTRSVDGVHRFLGRAWRLFEAHAGAGASVSDAAPSAEQMRTLHATIKRVTEDTDEMRFNTAISAMMEFVNAATKWETVPRQLLEPFALLLAPYAPHIAEELWSRLGHADTLAYEPWPQFDERYLVLTEVAIAVQVNGKLRGTVSTAADADESTTVAAALAAEGISKWVDGQTIKRRIFVPGRLLNFVVAPAGK